VARPACKYRFTAPSRACQWLALALLLLACGVRVFAASPEEDEAFNAASRGFQGGNYQWAEREFAAFAQRFPGSTRLGEALMLQVQCRFELKQFDGVIALAAARVDDPVLGDRFRYWLAQARLQKGEFEAAAREFGQLMERHPGTTRALEGSYGRAFAYHKLGRLERVVELLLPAEGAFRRSAKNTPGSTLVADGLLLLADALIGLNRAGDALQVLGEAEPLTPAGEAAWRRAQLLGRGRLVLDQADAARQAALRAVELAAAAGNTNWLAESQLLLGRALERVSDLAGAIAAYEKNLAETFPAVHRREALLRIIELQLNAGRSEETVARLEQFIQQHPQDGIRDLAHLTIGELRLREYYLYWSRAQTNNPASLPPSATNLLAQAQTNLDLVISGFATGPHYGKALLARGWCHWGAGRLAESGADFAAAVTNLPPSRDQFTARFKWADAQFRLGDARAALTNYQQVAALAPKQASHDANLHSQALYQVVQAATAAGDVAAGEGALDQLLANSTYGLYAQPALLLVGEAAMGAGQSAEARRILARFNEVFPGSPRAADAALAVARTHAQERDWPGAVRAYDGWLARHTNHPAQPQAAFALGWVHDLAGQAPDALTVFTNFLAQFPTNALAPLAQNWVADHYFSLGLEDGQFFVKAEEGYLNIFQNTNWAGNELAWPARLAAARAAVARQGYGEARGYLTNLINDARAPTNLVAQAFFALGDVLMNDPDLPAAERWVRAIGAFATVRDRFSALPIRPLAVGRIGQCYLQLAADDPANYIKAAEAFQEVVDSPAADVSARSNAKVGLAEVLKHQARTAPSAERAKLLEAAVGHCLDVFYQDAPFPGGFLRQGEKPDRFWVYQAGLTAARLCEELGQADRAKKTFERLRDLYPEQREVLQRMLEQPPARAALPAALPVSGFGQ
jgi:outer membrane protein assembly factor BamD (BamD/ComL family)